MSPKRNQNNPELSRQNIPESGADRLDFKQELILWAVLRARDSDDQSFKQESRHMLVDNIRSGIITRDFLKPIYESLGMERDFDNKKLSPSIIQDELIPLDQELLIEEQADTAKEKKTSSKDKQEIESPVIRPEEMPVLIKLNETIVPSNDRPRIVPGSGTFEQAGSIPRFEILTRLLLDAEFDNLPDNGKINQGDITVISGRNSENMIRRQSYRLILVKRLNKMVFVCNEENNNTFIINGIVEGVDSEKDITKLEDIYGLKKSQLRGLKQFGLLCEVRWSNKDRWEKRMAEALQTESALVGPIEEWRKIFGKDAQLEKAPEGWLTNSRLAIKLGCDAGTTSKIAEAYRTEHPQWFKNFLGRTNSIYTYYSPELIAIITKKLSRTEATPEGWMTTRAVAQKLGRFSKSILKMVEPYRQDHPEWFREYLDEGSRAREHYSPELIDILTAKISEMQEAPEGWLTKKRLSDTLGETFNAVSKIADQYRRSHPQWFNEYFVKKIKYKTEHLSPELVAIIKNELSSRESAPEGWYNQKNVAVKLNISQPTVNKMANKYRREHPEWFQYYYNKSNQHLKYYSPELVAEIERILSKKE